MIVGPLKKGLKGALPVIIPFFLACFISSFFTVSNSIPADSRNIFYSLIQNSVHSATMIYLLNAVCLITGATLITYFTVKHEIVDKQNFIPAFLYLFFCALTLTRGLVHPPLFSNIFILLALNAILDSYRAENALAKIFNAAFYTCIAMFFYLNYAFFILLYFISLFILRPFSWREALIGLLGLISPVFIYACIGYLANFNARGFLNDLIDLVLFFQKPLLSEYFYPVFISITILLILAISKHLTKGLGSKIKTQKTMGLVYWFLLLSVVNFFAKNNNFYFPCIASIIPLSILLGDYFFNIRQLKIANTLFFLLLASGSFLVLMHLNLF
ncbi:MAG: DUF6427 family protein [Bacteroidia bacterium]